MILITSAAYVGQELRSEFGLTPPAFLPVGNQPLYEYQVESLRNLFPDDPIFLSVPEHYTLDPFSKLRLDELGVSLVQVPEGLDLRTSISYCLTVIGDFDKPTRILHGDTWIRDLPAGLDQIAVAPTTQAYDWQSSDHSETVWSGYFSFSDTKLLVRELTVRNDFVDALKSYASYRPLEETPVDDWSDVGHFNTYFQTRELITTERAFNTLTIRNGLVIKSGSNQEKIENEARWFASLPLVQRPFAPAYYGSDNHEGQFRYFLEYLPMSPLNELFVHGRHPLRFWQGVCEQLDDWFAQATSLETRDDLTAERVRLNRDKVLSRMSVLADTRPDLTEPLPVLNGVELPPVTEIVAECIELALAKKPVPGLFHGDLCFSNILYDARNSRLRLIDPRGIGVDGTIIGDCRYDLAKLAHSFVGLYDFIIAKKYRLSTVQPGQWEFEIVHSTEVGVAAERFLDYRFRALPELHIRDLLPEVALLFFSMIPLHDDDPERQTALFCNGLRIYNMFKNLGEV